MKPLLHATIEQLEARRLLSTRISIRRSPVTPPRRQHRAAGNGQRSGRAERRESAGRRLGKRGQFPMMHSLLATRKRGADTSFGTNGIWRIDLGADESFDDLRIYSDGKILAGGSIDRGESLLVRLNTNGKPDTSFGKAGIALSAGVITRIDLQNGKIIAIGQNFVRKNTARRLDTSFGTAGAVNLTTEFNQPNFKAAGVTVQSDGKIIITGTMPDQYGDNEKAFTIRLLVNGVLARWFFRDGIVRNTADSASLAIDSIVQPSGKIVVLFSNGNDPSLVRYNADGSVDTTFKIAPTSLDFENVPRGDNNFSETPASIIQQSDGKIVVSGTLHPANGPVLEIGVVRLTADGKPDTSISPVTAKARPISRARAALPASRCWSERHSRERRYRSRSERQSRHRRQWRDRRR